MFEHPFNEKNKQHQLALLKNEVNDFHPLLHRIFPKLPRIQHVEYTHGQYEKGADFVLSREDDTLGETEYIGVIVKTGDIHQNLVAVESQIDDCDGERYILNGKKNIRLDEIWIITNENITQGAKEKINRKFSTRKIKFFKHTDIISLIDRYLPNYWHNISVDIGEYLNRVNSQIVNYNDALNLLPTHTGDFYVEQYLEEVEKEYNFHKRHYHKKKQKAHIFDIIEQNRLVFIEGGAGFGKSRLLRHTVQYYCNPLSYIKYHFVPILVTYRDFCDVYNRNIEKLIQERIDKDTLQKIEESATLLILIDGFDEKYVEVQEENEKLIELIEEVNSSKRKIKVLITSRPINLVDQKKLSTTRIGWYELTALSFNDILKFFNKICDNSKISSRILEDIKKSQLFKELPKSPIAAILLANLINENARELPSNLTELFQKYSELMLGRWDIAKGLQSQKEYEAAVNIIIQIAYYFTENDLEYIAIDEAKKFFIEYLTRRNLDIDSEDLFNKTTSRSGILQKEPIYNRIYFKHKTFREFFYAQYKIKFTDEHFIDDRVYNMYWRNTYFFYVGLQKDCEQTLSTILRVQPVNEFQRFLRIINMADYFLAGYATPYEVIKENLYKLIIEATDLYFDIINNKTKTPFQSWPEMAILYIFHAFMRTSYSYEFFNKALEQAIVEILADKHLSDDVKVYSMYFISVIYIELKLPNPFGGLLENFGDNIPLPIQFAIKYEDEQILQHSAILKKQQKNLMRKLKGSRYKDPELSNYVKDLFQLPVNKKLKKIESKMIK